MISCLLITIMNYHYVGTLQNWLLTIFGVRYMKTINLDGVWTFVWLANITKVQHCQQFVRQQRGGHSIEESRSDQRKDPIIKVLWGHGSQPQCITLAVGAINVAVGNEDYNVAEGLLSSDFI